GSVKGLVALVADVDGKARCAQHRVRDSGFGKQMDVRLETRLYARLQLAGQVADRAHVPPGQPIRKQVIAHRRAEVGVVQPHSCGVHTLVEDVHADHEL